MISIAFAVEENRHWHKPSGRSLSRVTGRYFYRGKNVASVSGAEPEPTIIYVAKRDGEKAKTAHQAVCDKIGNGYC